MKTLSLFIKLLKERFPLGNWLFALLFWMAALAPALTTPWEPSLLFSFLFVGLFFFRLRLMDDLKDFSTDQKAHPLRPLPAGWIKVPQMKALVLVVIILEILLLSLWNPGSLPYYPILLSFSLLMYLEFFLPQWLEAHLSFYFWSHSLISPLLVMFILFDHPEFWHRALEIWVLLLAYEISRKTFSAEQEKEGQASYSLSWGWKGALAHLLVFFLAFPLLGAAFGGLSSLPLWLSLPVWGFWIGAGVFVLCTLFFSGNRLSTLGAKIVQGVGAGLLLFGLLHLFLQEVLV